MFILKGDLFSTGHLEYGFPAYAVQDRYLDESGEFVYSKVRVFPSRIIAIAIVSVVVGFISACMWKRQKVLQT